MNTVRKHNLLKFGLWIYTVMITIICIKLWHINLNYTQSKNTEFSWNHDNTLMQTFDKKSRKLLFLHQDQNYDLNFERIEQYANGKGPISVFYDHDEDGSYESVTYYSINNRYAGYSVDQNRDHLYDHTEMVLDNGDTLSKCKWFFRVKRNEALSRVRIYNDCMKLIINSETLILK